MEIKYISKDFKISLALRVIINKKVVKLEKYFTGDVHVNVSALKQNNAEKLEIFVYNKGEVFIGEACASSLNNAVDLAVEKAKRQIVAKKRKQKHFDRKKIVECSPEAIENSAEQKKEQEELEK